MTSGFQNADRYEQLMGRWSRRLAPSLIRFGGLGEGDRVLDMGCGTGSLTFALPAFANVASATGIDLTESYIAAARARSTDARFTFDVGDACALPYPDSSFDRAFSLLVLHFIPETRRAVEEMRRVVRPGGTITAAVWDGYGGQPFARILWDIAGVLDPTLQRPLFRPLNGPGEMEKLWLDLGLRDVEQVSLLTHMEFQSFEDYWAPFASGEGPHGQYVVKLPDEKREILREHVRRAYIANRPDGPRSMVAVAWACRGTVPD
ncbi:class I SAM-dependent methyltransferase [Reyranella sp.]|uniref:class I SAM-dependent methyltransferase n=1 Tax=Reyranella sp. TaxID=1929291 RepID=UPI0025D75799|nr:class I SAM-dependent methyltransferase [Reyranella sp.]